MANLSAEKASTSQNASSRDEQLFLQRAGLAGVDVTYADSELSMLEQLAYVVQRYEPKQPQSRV